MKCTALGFQLAALPVAPRYAKMLLAAAIASQGMEASRAVARTRPNSAARASGKLGWF